MNGKVSMVMACYNKAGYLGNMLRSVHAQTWLNLELVFVNDGSTDGSMDVFREWEPRLIERGIEVVAHSQPNGGVTAAIRSGLEMVTGDYVCFPDADDELDPRYAELLVYELESDPGLDFALCAFGSRYALGGRIDTYMEPERDFRGHPLLERALLWRFSLSSCRYLFRMDCVRNAGFPESLDTARIGSQEPALLIPLLGAGGRYSRIPETLYIYNRYAQGLAQTQNKKPLERVAGGYHAQQLRAIGSLPVPERRKLELASFARFGITMVSNMMLSRSVMSECFYWAESNRMLGDAPRGSLISGRVIAYGSLGTVASRVIPELKGTVLWPELFWDKAAGKGSAIFDGTPVTPIQPCEIKPGDTILCFPKIVEVYEEARALAEVRGATALSYYDVMDTLANILY